MAILPQPPELPGAPGDKVQHMMAFFTLGAIAAVVWRGRGLLVPFAGLAAFGALIELIQTIPALHRDAEVLDWLVDMGAAMLALLAVRVVLSRD